MNEHAVSRQMTRLLRHGAEKSRLPMRPDGFALFTDIVTFGRINMTEEVALRIVAADKKTRFSAFRDEDNRLWIRANQGHTMSSVDRNQLLKPITDSTKYAHCIHGTTLQAWETIRKVGLSRMRRNEIHFAQGEFGTVTSGFRSSSQVLVYVNLSLCLAKGILFFESDNGVLLSPGIEPDGIIPPCFFLHARDVKTGQPLEFMM